MFLSHCFLFIQPIDYLTQSIEARAFALDMQKTRLDMLPNVVKNLQEKKKKYTKIKSIQKTNALVVS